MPKRLDGMVIFGVEQWGFNKDEVGAHIARIHQEYEKLYTTYQSLAKKHKRLNEKYKALSEKPETGND